VAAALTMERFTQFISLSRDYLKNPSEAFFRKTKTDPMTDEEILNSFEKRKTGFVAICFKTPDTVEDVLYPQLFKIQKSVEMLLEQHDFSVIRTNVWAGDKAILTILAYANRRMQSATLSPTPSMVIRYCFESL
jgi:tRNA nucleotidyltransferase (CCA-adding enzyme)